MPSPGVSVIRFIPSNSWEVCKNRGLGVTYHIHVCQSGIGIFQRQGKHTHNSSQVKASPIPPLEWARSDLFSPNYQGICEQAVPGADKLHQSHGRIHI